MTLVRVADIEHVFENRLLPVRVVDERDALGAAFHPSVHPFVPELDRSAGDGLVPLRVDEHLVGEGVFVHPADAGEERSPGRGVLRHLPDVRGEDIRRALQFRVSEFAIE
ncbi:hypothetical protein LJC31_00270 [Synergistaceae bacterium OttesenSCG-928-I11]|nr:hypothetical protein [Synergistaceae bacterium OttesenSCG-928-I11]